MEENIRCNNLRKELDQLRPIELKYKDFEEKKNILV